MHRTARPILPAGWGVMGFVLAGGLGVAVISVISPGGLGGTVGSVIAPG